MMKIVFSTQGKDWDALINPKFGRATGFLCYDTERDRLTYHTNKSNVEAEHGVGIQTAQFVANIGADVVITGGNVGPKATQVLQKAGVKIIEFAGEIPVREAYTKYFGR